MKDIIEDVAWGESYVLGWSVSKNCLQIFVELQLSEGHPRFSPFDNTSEYGCYRTATIVLEEVRRVTGLPSVEQSRAWDESLGEFKDYAEIDSIKLEDGEFQLEIDGIFVSALFSGIVLLID